MDMNTQDDSHAEPLDWKIAEKYYKDLNPNLPYSRRPLLETKVDIDDELFNICHVSCSFGIPSKQEGRRRMQISRCKHACTISANSRLA